MGTLDRERPGGGKATMLNAWWREEESLPVRTEAERDAIVLAWKARIYANANGYRVDDGTRPIPAPPARPIPDDLMTITEAAAAIGVKRQTVYEGLWAAEVQAYHPKLGTKARVSLADVKRWNATRPRLVRRRA